jgi:hypothetical protein
MMEDITPACPEQCLWILNMLSDPDGQPFSTSWHASDEDPLSGWVTTSWKQELGISGSVVARFNHS